MSAAELATLLLDTALVAKVARTHAWEAQQQPEALLLAAKHYGVAIDAAAPAKKAAA